MQTCCKMADIDDLFDCFESTETNGLVPPTLTTDDEKPDLSTFNFKSLDEGDTNEAEKVVDNKR